MRQIWCGAVGVLIILLTGCGDKTLLGVKNAFEVSMTADNKSAYPLQVGLMLTQASNSDHCENASAEKSVDVPPQAVKEDSLTLKCEHPPKNAVSLALHTPGEPAVQWAALALDDAKAALKAPLAIGTEVRWRVDAATVQSGKIGSFDWVERDGVRTPADDPTTVTAPDAAAFAAANVRAAAKKVQVYVEPGASVLAIGLPAAQFEGKPDSAVELEGFYYFTPQIQAFGGTLVLARALAAGKIACDDRSCTLDIP